ncbi:MAG: hypothetical protein QM687_13355 [Ferruginibacter sp.]
MTTWEKAFESEKNRKAATYTAIILGVLLLMFFLISWKTQPPTPPVVEDLIEINLGNNEKGWGEEQPLIKGEMSPSDQASVVPRQQAKAPEEAEEPVTPDDNAEEAAAPVTKTVKETPKVTKPAVTTPTPTPTPKPQKPKITYNGPGNGNGNNATQDNGYTMQGNNRNGTGDAGSPTGHPDSYGNTPGGKVAGGALRVSKGDRRIINNYIFMGDLPKATINAIIKVSPEGKGTFVSFDKGSTSTDGRYATAIRSYLPNIQFNKSDHESIVTVPFNFRVQ